MSHELSRKIKEAAERIKESYDVIGHQTAAPFLAIVYPHENEFWVMKEWHVQASSFTEHYDLLPINILDITTNTLQKFGVENIIAAEQDPIPGTNPREELGNLWMSEIIAAIKTALHQHEGKPPVIVLEKLAALYPVAGPRFLLQQCWDTHADLLQCPIVVFIPGVLKEPRVYRFLDIKEEFMYRGDIL